MSFDPLIAEIRFGIGLSPVVTPPESVDAMMANLTGPDIAAQAFEIPQFTVAEPSPAQLRQASLDVGNADGQAARTAAEEARATMRANARDALAQNMKMEIGRSVTTRDGLREQLARFWADHFTVRAVTGTTRHLVSPYIEEAIRPHVAGRFVDMLRAVIISPMMLVYLDQHLSIGPNSEVAERSSRGLNENLARELLELHTLGVGGGYSQADVLELAELLTGLSFSARNGFRFNPKSAEPGAETVLGVAYGGGEPSLDDILAGMEGLAMHPDTAQHLATKLAVHFIGPVPDTDLISAMAARYLETGSDLGAMTEVMLRHPSAWAMPHQKVKWPLEYVLSAMRALALPADVIRGATLQQVRQLVYNPIRVMGQQWQTPIGPDGWPEEDDAWITPQGMAGRISWAMTVPERLMRELPDPRDFVVAALGPEPPETVAFAARAAESRTDGIGVVLASAAFQRR